MEVNGQLHAPAALTPGKELPVPIGEEAGWAPQSVWGYITCRKLKTSFPKVAVVYSNFIAWHRMTKITAIFSVTVKYVGIIRKLDLRIIK
jgi:hypothetical protein